LFVTRSHVTGAFVGRCWLDSRLDSSEEC